MPQPAINKLVSRIYGNGRGWAFSQKDFSGLGTRSAIDVSLHRLHEKGTIRRVLRGIYDYPQVSEKLGRQLSPDIDQVARALARKSGWRIQPTGPAALNLLGLSTQVMGRYAYLSDGPDRVYAIGKRTIEFQHTALKESGFKLRESSLVVQALRSLGEERIDESTISKLRDFLGPDLCTKVLKDTRTARGWVHDTILAICREVR
ncbi:MAG: hypothetical protein KAY32_03820 [Candidatus Eisenbacteria sp.]|nr:hypothetical protein [Candidatus Eisenbacteria bacterium]